MRKSWVIVTAGIFLMGVFSLVALSSAQQPSKFRPKALWRAMLANVRDVQGIVAALPVFDMKAISDYSDSLSKRNIATSKVEAAWNTPPNRERYARLGEAAATISAAAKAEDLDGILKGLNAVLATCNDCHLTIRDKPPAPAPAPRP